MILLGCFTDFILRRRNSKKQSLFTRATVSINPSRIIDLIQFDDHVDRFIETVFRARDFYAADYLELLVFRYVIQDQERRGCAVLRYLRHESLLHVRLLKNCFRLSRNVETISSASLKSAAAGISN